MSKNDMAATETVRLQRKVMRWALLTVPVIVLLGLASGQLSGSGENDLWFSALVKPAIYPPGWVFGAVWTILYVMMGFALAYVLAAPKSPARTQAVVAFVVQFVVNLLWSPIFFGAHLIAVGFFWILTLLVLVLTTMAYFSRVSRVAVLLLVPYLAWVSFAAILNLRFWQLN